MPVLSLPINPKGSRPILPHVFIGDPKKNIFVLNQKNKVKQGSIEPIKGGIFTALFDTGATSTCINEKVVKRLGLSSIGKTAINSASHANHEVSIYKIVVAITHQQVINKKVLPDGKIISLDIASVPISSFQLVNAVQLPPTGKEFDVIIGMDIISTGLIVLNGIDNRLTISF